MMMINDFPWIWLSKKSAMLIRENKTIPAGLYKIINSMFIMLLIIAFNVSLPAAETVFASDFSTAPSKDKMKLTYHCKVDKGLLSIGQKTGKFYPRIASFHIPLDKPFVMNFSLRVTTFTQPKHQMGFTLHSSEKKRYYQFCSAGGDGYVILVGNENRRIIDRKNFQNTVKIGHGATVPMAKVELRCNRSLIELKVNGTSLGAVPLKFMPINKIDFWATNMEIQIDDLKITTLDEKKVTYARKPVFYAPFDDKTTAVIEGNKTISPALEGKGKVQFSSAAKKQGVKIDNYDLTYDVKGLLADAGAVMFWIKPSKKLALQTIYFKNAAGKNRLACRAQGYAFSINFYNQAGQDKHLFLRGSKYFMFGPGNNLFHYAVTWDKDGSVRIFRNGMPYIPGCSWENSSDYCVPGFDLSDVEKIIVSRRSNAVIDDLKIYRRPVSVEEVYAAYREAAPLDIVVPDAVIEPVANAEISLKVAPGGYYTRPVHGNKPYIDADGELSLTLYSLDKNKADTPLKTLKQKIKVGKIPLEVKFPVGKLAEGDYQLRCEFMNSAGFLSRKGIVIKVADFPKANPATTKDIQLGKVVFEKKFTSADDKSILHEGGLHAVDGKYLEAGSKNGNRFSVVISNLKEYIQKPMIIEVTWPDDKQRMMGLYAYTENHRGESYRDRLQGGIQAGREIPNSGKMVKTRYLIYPQTPSYLFEARTLANDFPAAVSELKVYEIKGSKLPKLKINYPKGLPHRLFGNNDEDQTLCINMAKNDLVGLTERILEYLDYTGQDAFHYQLLRYYFSFFPYPGGNGNSLYPYMQGGMGYVIDAMKKRGKEFTGIFNLNVIPEIFYAPVVKRDLVKTGMVSLDKNLRQRTTFNGMKGTPNVACPEVRKAYTRLVEDLSEDLRNPGIKGVSFWLTMGWPSLSDGYDDYTVNKFSRETGIKVPATGRYEFLTSEKMLPQWSKWRAGQVFQLIKEVRQTLDKVNPELAIYVMRRGPFDWDPYLDPMLKQLPRTYPCDLRRPTNYRLDFHWGRPESDREETMYDFEAVSELFKRKSNQCVSLFYIYYESYIKPLDRKNYGCYFQNADVKPHGRHFLKELAFNVAAGDVLELVMGGQPFASLGRDSETREFARAFGALPRLSFNTVKNPNHSIVVRYLKTKNGTYFYVVSNVWTNSRVRLDWAGADEYVDLSTNKKLTGKTIELKPYELRSFLIPDKKVVINSFKEEFPAELKSFYQKRIATLEAAVKKYESKGLSVSKEKARIKQIKQAVRSENYAEAHRLGWSVIMNSLLAKLKSIDTVAKQQKMIKENRFALNCGSSEFYRAPDGRLFFPDVKFSDESRYGYFGSHSCANRKIGGLKNNTEAELFRTEAWNIDGYKFKLANGKYKIRLYMKVGWPDDFKPGKVVLSVYANNQPVINDLKMHKAQNGDFSKPVIKDFHTVVSDGQLTLKFKAGKGLGTNIHLCNAIEIQPEA